MAASRVDDDLWTVVIWALATGFTLKHTRRTTPTAGRGGAQFFHGFQLGRCDTPVARLQQRVEAALSSSMGSSSGAVTRPALALRPAPRAVAHGLRALCMAARARAGYSRTPRIVCLASVRPCARAPPC